MLRLVTSVALAAWIGFLGVFVLELLADALAPGVVATLASGAPPRWLAAMFDDPFGRLALLGRSGELVVAALCCAVVALLVRALYRLQSPSGRDTVKAERLSAVAFACIGLLTLASYASAVPLLPVDAAGGSVWLALGLSVVAFVFDRLVAIEADDTSERDFEAGIAAIALGMSEQTRRYTPSRLDERGALR